MARNKEDLIKIGEAIRMERLRRRMSQDNLAELAGLAQAQHISKIENAEVDIRISTLLAIFRVLNLSLDDIVGLNNDKK